MLKKLVVFVCALFLSLPGVSYAKKENKHVPHPNESAYEHANEHARFKRGLEDSKEKAEWEAKKAKKKLKKESKKAKKKLKNGKGKAEKDLKEKKEKLKGIMDQE